VATSRELRKARRAIARGRSDEALVLLWNLLEPARIEGDERVLRAIGDLAHTIARADADHRLEAERLLRALGRLAPAARTSQLTGGAAAPPEPVSSEGPLAEREQELPLPWEPAADELELGSLERLPEPEQAEESPEQRRGLARYLVPIALLVLVLVNVLARILGED
jgi:hypothetical protein